MEHSSITGRFQTVCRALNLSGLIEAFDRCQCNSLWNILKVYCMPTKIMNLIKVLCQGSAWTVKVNGNLHKWANETLLSTTHSWPILAEVWNPLWMENAQHLCLPVPSMKMFSYRSISHSCLKLVNGNTSAGNKAFPVPRKKKMRPSSHSLTWLLWGLLGAELVLWLFSP